MSDATQVSVSPLTDTVYDSAVHSIESRDGAVYIGLPPSACRRRIWLAKSSRCVAGPVSRSFRFWQLALKCANWSIGRASAWASSCVWQAAKKAVNAFAQSNDGQRCGSAQSACIRRCWPLPPSAQHASITC